MFGSMVVGLEAGELFEGFDEDVELLFGLTLEGEAAADDPVGLPEGLEDLAPGLLVHVILASLDRRGLSGYDRVRVLQAGKRLVSHLEASVYTDMAGVYDATVGEFPELGAGEVWDAASMEVAAALGWTRRAADAHLELALGLVEQPRVWGMLSAGVVDVPRVRVILEAVEGLDAVEADAVIGRVAGQAGGLTTGQLRVRLQRLVLEVDPGSAERRYRRSVADRRVEVMMSSTGSVHLSGLDLPVVEAAEAWELLSHTALMLKQLGDPRTLDQLRADIYLDLLTGRATTTGVGRRGVVNLTVGYDTLTGAATPGEIPGLGPILADIARDLATNPQQQWCYQTSHDDHTHVGALRRTPSPGLKRRVHATHPTCIAPGCRTPASRCDLDHTTPHSQDGPTCQCNLAPLCRHHHQTKHHTPWQLHKHPDNSYQWTSPLKHTYTTNGQSP